MLHLVRTLFVILWLARLSVADDLSVPVEKVQSVTGRRTDGLPTVVAHRGASGKRPEHTLAAYQLALEEGADLVEPDLQLTRDGVLIALHDTTLNRMTDVGERPEFAGRSKPDRDGKPVWLPHDFTLAELRTLRVRHVVKGHATDFDRTQLVPTFAEVVRLVRDHNQRRTARVGVCPELKNVAGQLQVGLDPVAVFLTAVQDLELESASSLPVVVQSFELNALESLRPKTKLPLVFLSASRPDPQTMSRIGKTVNVIGVGVKAVAAADSKEWIESLHRQGFGVYVWTYREDAAAMKQALALGIDGFFTDFPDIGVATRDAAIR